MLDNGQVQLEQEILSSILKNSELIITAKEVIKPYMFLYEPHVNIYLGIMEMVNKKMSIDLVNFLEYQRENINSMDGVSYVTEIYTCNPSDSGFNTKLELLIRGYKKHLYVEMGNKILRGMSIDEIEAEVENTKVNIHKCQIKKELDITQEYDEYLTWLYNENRDQGIKSGFYYIDKYLGNFQKGRLITVFARSGVGKSTFSIQAAANMVFSGAKVFYGSAEMSTNQIFNKMAASALSLSSNSIDEDSILVEQKDSISKLMAKLMSSSFYVSTETDLDKFIHEIKVYKLQNNLDVVFVDYINKYVDFGEKDIMTNYCLFFIPII